VLDVQLFAKPEVFNFKAFGVLHVLDSDRGKAGNRGEEL